MKKDGNTQARAKVQSFQWKCGNREIGATQTGYSLRLEITT